MAEVQERERLEQLQVLQEQAEQQALWEQRIKSELEALCSEQMAWRERLEQAQQNEFVLIQVLSPCFSGHTSHGIASFAHAPCSLAPARPKAFDSPEYHPQPQITENTRSSRTTSKRNHQIPVFQQLGKQVSCCSDKGRGSRARGGGGDEG